LPHNPPARAAHILAIAVAIDIMAHGDPKKDAKKKG